MAFDDIKAEIYDLLSRSINQPEDAHEIQARVHELIAELRATGMPVPEDLKKLEDQLNEELGPRQ